MKIAYIADSIIPSRTASSIHVMKMCQAFAKAGHEVFLLVPHKGGEAEEKIADVYQYYGVEKIFEITRCSGWRYVGKNLIFSLLISRKIRELRPDLVYDRSLFGAVSALCHNHQVIIESHYPIHSISRVCAFFFGRLINRSNFVRLIVISHRLASEYLEHYGALSGKITVAPDGADANEEPRDRSCRNHDRGRFQVGYVGHLYKGRGIEIIEALATACEWADFNVIGGMEEELNYWRARTAHVDNISFHGFYPPAQAARFCSEYQVLLAPYQNQVAVSGGGDTARYMSPLKIFEYMAAGKAIIASDLPVLREVLQHNRNALLVCSDGENAWIDALTLLYKDADLRVNLGKESRRDFFNNYSWQKRAKRILTAAMN